jgi:hypothetical protein
VPQPDDIRYGVFLTPDAKTSAAVTSITGFVRAQFGLVSANRFPPHLTLAGSLPITIGEEDFLDVVNGVAGRHVPFEIWNSGIGRLGDAAVVFDVHGDASGNPNATLIDLAADVANAVQPLLRPVDSLPADLPRRQSWRGHLSLASHELLDRVDLRDEVEAFIHQLDIAHPSYFPAQLVAVFRLHHHSWTGPWWTSFRWEHLRSFRLGKSVHSGQRSTSV